LCRREGTKLFLKGPRCDSAKCGFTKRDYPPGPKVFRRGKPSGYALQLREKQKVKRYYGLLDRTFMRFFEMANRVQGNSGDELMSLLERSLANIIFRLGWATSNKQARQLVNQGHVFLNGRRVSIPSYIVAKGDVITARKREDTDKVIRSNMDLMRSRELPSWLARDEAELKATVVDNPKLDEIPIEVKPQLIVELCSK
jgi:small subunit ribosomal protein S4